SAARATRGFRDFAHDHVRAHTPGEQVVRHDTEQRDALVLTAREYRDTVLHPLAQLVAQRTQFVRRCHLDACRDEAYAVDLLCGRQELTDASTRPRSACLRELAAQIALFLRQLLDATQQRIRRRLEHCRRLLEHRVTCNAAVVRLAARHRFDAADARSHTALA